ncbi:hypothetical protein AAZX31_08G062400 [Glycine max]
MTNTKDLKKNSETCRGNFWVQEATGYSLLCCYVFFGFIFGPSMCYLGHSHLFVGTYALYFCGPINLGIFYMHTSSRLKFIVDSSKKLELNLTFILHHAHAHSFYSHNL